MDLSQEDFKVIAELVLKEAAIVIEPGKEYLVRTRLVPLVKSSNLASIRELVESLKNSNSDSSVKKAIVEALTTNETTFFRDLDPFHLLRDKLLPTLITKRKDKKSIQIWSAACSSGQEPYSIAMMIVDTFPNLKDWNIEIFATDLSSQILNKAKEGVFNQFEINRGLPANYLIKYFTKEDNNWRLKEEVRSKVKFFELNLMRPFQGIPAVDVVFLRNVLIYFSVDTKKDILARVRRVLRSDGTLLLGSAESTLNVDDNFERNAFGTTSYYQLKQS